MSSGVQLKKLSVVTKLHYVNFALRLSIFVVAVVIYIINRIEKENFEIVGNDNLPWYFLPVWLFFMGEMILRLIPSKLESVGCQKQFKTWFKPTKEKEPKHRSWKGAFYVAIAWITLNAVIGALYLFGVLDQGSLILFSLAYSVGDMVCVLFICPFQHLFMKNRCCADCRIYNWDFAMMFTPFILIPHFYTWSLLFLSLVLLFKWEFAVRRHPERFSTNTNGCLSCENCNEKLCQHKKQIKKQFLRK